MVLATTQAADWTVFVIAAVVVLAGGLGVVTSRHPVHSALFLIQTLFGVAVLFVAEGAALPGGRAGHRLRRRHRGALPVRHHAPRRRPPRSRRSPTRCPGSARWPSSWASSAWPSSPACCAAPRGRAARSRSPGRSAGPAPTWRSWVGRCSAATCCPSRSPPPCSSSPWSPRWCSPAGRTRVTSSATSRRPTRRGGVTVSASRAPGTCPWPPCCSRIGAVGLLVRRNVLVMFMCVELMLNAVNLTFVTFARMLNDIGGQTLVFFVMVVAAAEVVVGLGIIVGHLPPAAPAPPPTTSTSSRAERADRAPRRLGDPRASRSPASSCSILGGKRLGDPWAGWLATLDGGRVVRHSRSIVFIGLCGRGAGQPDRSSRRLCDWVPVGGFKVDDRPPARPAVGHHGPLRHRRRARSSTCTPSATCSDDPGFPRFFVYLNLFLFSMLMLVLGRQLPAHVPRLGGGGHVLVPAHLLLVRAEHGGRRPARRRSSPTGWATGAS